MGMMAEVEEAICTVLGAATPAEGFKRLLSRQGTCIATAGGNWAGVDTVQHQVHMIEGARAEREEEEAEAPGSDTEREGQWEQQDGWSKAARRREQVLGGDQEDASEEARGEQTGTVGEARAQRGKAAAESYEKRQMLRTGMSGRSWTRLVQEWGVPRVEALQLQKSIVALMREMGPRLGDLHWKESIGLGRESKVRPGEAMGMLEAARTARRLRELGWCGEKGQGGGRPRSCWSKQPRSWLRAGGTWSCGMATSRTGHRGRQWRGGWVTHC